MNTTEAQWNVYEQRRRAVKAAFRKKRTAARSIAANDLELRGIIEELRDELKGSLAVINRLERATKREAAMR